MRRIVLLVCMSFMLTGAFPQTIHIGLYQDQLVTSSVVYCSSGNYHLVAGEKILTRFGEGDILYLTLENEMLRVLDAGHDFGYFSEIELRGTTTDCVFRIRPLQPELESRIYDDDLVVSAGDRFMTLVNRVDMDKYLAGVVEAEAGANAEKEFYKAQSILCRTFTLKNLDRHLSEGFSLCDGVHCQAYRGKSLKNPDILTAILETTGLVLADYHFRLITAAYHSNSGGQTQRASEVWLTDADYLQSVVDPFSLHQPHAKWRDTISFSDWKSYLLENGMKSVRKIPDEIIYVEQMRRKKYFILDKDSIRMTKIREDWGFPSAFFDMFPDGDSILIWGKGYGHGIGLSQEGAMKMAMDGYTFRDILQFYFYEVRLMDYRDLPASSIPDVTF
jgi:stage II sporulation protein D